MEIIATQTKSLKYINNVLIVPDYYENGALYIGLYNADIDEPGADLYADLSTYIMPVLPLQFYVKKGSEQENFVKEQTDIFFNLEREVKQGFNTYCLYKYNGFLH